MLLNEDGQNNFPKHVELTGIINKPLLLHLVGCLYYLYQWCTVKQISYNEIYLLIKYIKSVVWRVAKCLSYIEEARCLKVKTICIRNWQVCQPYAPAAFIPRNISVRGWVDSRVIDRPEVLCQWKIPVTPSAIDFPTCGAVPQPATLPPAPKTLRLGWICEERCAVFTPMNKQQVALAMRAERDARPQIVYVILARV